MDHQAAGQHNGVFTKEILTALVTSAADSDSDGLVTLDELLRYVARRTRERQHPELERDNQDARMWLPVTRAAEPVLTRPDPLAN